MALNKRVWRIVKESKSRYIGIVLLILLGSFYFIVATGISGNLEKMVVAETMNMLIPMIVNPLYVLISFVLIFAVYEITRRLGGRILAKIPMSEALKAGAE